MINVIELIKKADSVCVLGHISEDADSVGSCLAAKTLLEGLGKKADIYLSAPVERRLRFLGIDAEIFDGMVRAYDLCLCIDCADMARLGARRALFDAAKSTAQIDHHGTNTGFADANYIVAEASSAGELVYNVFVQMGAEIDKKCAGFLFAAIASDTGSFKYSNIGAETMRICAELLETGIDNAYISRMLFDTTSVEMMHFKGYVMTHVNTYFAGRLAMICVSAAEFSRFGVEEKDAGDIVNIARETEGAELAVSVREVEDKVKISFRSNGKYRVDTIAALFGGGGHRMASGATVSEMSLEEAAERVRSACCEVLEND